VNSGSLSLGAPDCGAGWTLDGGTPYTTQQLVPGDTLTKVCTIDLVAEGEHLGADLAIATPGWDTTNPLTDELAASATFEVNGAAVTHVTDADDTGTDEIEATLVVTFDGPAATNASQSLSAVLNAVTVSATQTHDG
jgi:alternate signal-mediated exported protein